MKVCRVAEMRQMDKQATAEYGIPAEILMENAGEAVYAVIQKEIGVEGKKFIILCGPGNNGGDGFVVARKLHSSGGEVKVLLLADREKYQGTANMNIEIIERFPIEIKAVKTVRQIKADIASADGVIDALLGTGLDRDVDGLLRQAIEIVNASGKRVFAVDIASGINGDNGQEMGTSIKAEATVTFGLPKLGNLLYPGYSRGGKLYVSHISFPNSLYDSEAIKVEITKPVPLPERQADTNKMDYGPVLVIAGAANYYWAPHASAYSFLKAGGGYAYLACPKSMAPAVAKKGREIVIHPQQETASGSIALENKDDLLKLAERMKMVVLGPGLSLDEETQELVRILAAKIEKPLLIDGDGLTAIAGTPETIKKRKLPTVLTPHIGEMSRLTGINRSEIEKDRVGILQKTAQKLNAHIVLKGPHSLIGCPDGRVFINNSGDTEGKAGMATAGSGDILNGTIAAMLCLGLSVEDAVKTGVFVHGLSGDLAAKKKGTDGMTAQDILDNLPHAVKYYRENLRKISADYNNTVFVV
ncbi:MAG: NAD(P)H-hydrate dehydratase [Dehalococcoidales bacterium]|nr:NAD(P)H-hydrate dehydratase [Dehalococcoidales bacterium]